MEQCIVRPATMGDLDAICDLVSRAVAQMIAEGSEQWGTDYPTRVHYEEDIQKNRLLVAVSPEDKVVGVACYTDEVEESYAPVPWEVPNPAAVIHRMAVDPNARRMGVGYTLFAYVEAWAIAKGLPTFHVDTYSKNVKMQGLFRKRGFVQKGSINLHGRPLPYPAFEKLL